MKKDLQELFKRYIYECRYVTRLREQTIKGYENTFNTFSKLMPNIKYSEQLDEEVILEFLSILQTRERIVGRDTVVKGIKDSTVKTYWSKLNSYFDWLHKKEYLKENPLKNMRSPQPVYDDHRALRRNEIDKIITSVMRYPKDILMLKRDLVIVHILLFCGLRKGELLGLKISDVDLDRKKIRVCGETSKSKTTRYLPINPSLYIHLKDYLRELRDKRYQSEYLIVSTNIDRNLTSHGLKHWVKRIEKLSGIRFHLHRFRHTFAMNVANQGAGFNDLQKLMGHKDSRMTERYLRSVGIEDMRRNVNRMTLDNLI